MRLSVCVLSYTHLTSERLFVTEDDAMQQYMRNPPPPTYFFHG